MEHSKLSGDRFDFFPAEEIGEVSLKDLSTMVEQLFTGRAELERKQKLLDEESKQLEILKAKIVGILNDHNQKEFSHAGFGKVYTQTKYQVSFPKDPEKAEVLRKYLEERGMTDLLTVNHMTFNATFNAEAEAIAAEHGTVDLNNVFPGVEAPTARVVLAMKKGK